MLRICDISHNPASPGKSFLPSDRSPEPYIDGRERVMPRQLADCFRNFRVLAVLHPLVFQITHDGKTAVLAGIQRKYFPVAMGAMQACCLHLSPLSYRKEMP